MNSPRFLRLTSLAVALLASGATLVSAQNYSPSTATLSVTGSAEIKIAPDEIVLSVGVESRHAELAQAKLDNDTRIERALKFLRADQVAERDMQTDFLAVHPVYDSSSHTVPHHYEVQKNIEIRLRKVESFEAILTGLLANGVNEVHDVNFRTSELRKHRDAARQMAIRAAREKADALAAELGVKRGKVCQVSENAWGGSWGWSSSRWGGGQWQNSMSNASNNAGGGSDPGDGSFAVGQISVSATVNVSFLIE